tara:strand:- start:7 stop:429 length:423 start_codon:yes stop_codon:yes gene_type:complete
MGRKHTLQTKVDAAIRQSRYGSPQTRRKHRQEMHQFLEDCATLKEVPETIEQITPRLIKRVVRLWRSRHLSENTIHTRLSFLRRMEGFNKMKIVVPSNQALRVVKPKLMPLQLQLPNGYQEKIHHPLTHGFLIKLFLDIS